MYETPSRTSSRLSSRKPPSQMAPSIDSNGASRLSRFSTRSTSNLSTNGPFQQREMIAPLSNTSPMKSPTISGRNLRKPLSMQSMNSLRNHSSKPGTPRQRSASGDVYKGKIHVGVRARPDKDPLNSNPTWYLDPTNNLVEHESAGIFTFDKVYTGETWNEQVFVDSVLPLIQQVVNGFNATVLAYGTTGSGKTYTMQGSETDPGVISRSVQLLFDMLGDSSAVTLSYYEIYNERIYDLLSMDKEPSEVSLRDGNNGETKIFGHREVLTASARELLDWVASGDQLRRTSSTQYNEHSSRSHAVVRIGVNNNGAQSILYLCDLAGSERAVEHSERRREGSFINKSLLTLSSVISILSQGGYSHVPYRDSKLTRLLQPSLSGTALVSMVCTIQTTSGGSSAETLNSIRFAAKAKNITVTAKRSSVFDEGPSMSAANLRLIDHLQQENEILRREFVKQRQEKEDLYDRLKLFEQAADRDTENSLEAMTGISFSGDDTVDIGASQEILKQGDNNSYHENADYLSIIEGLKNEVEKYRTENADLNQRISHLVSEITALDTNFSRLEASEAIKNGQHSNNNQIIHSTVSNDVLNESIRAENQSLKEQVQELVEQLRDKTLALDCLTQMNSANYESDLSNSNYSLENLTTERVSDLHIH